MKKETTHTPGYDFITMIIAITVCGLTFKLIQSRSPLDIDWLWPFFLFLGGLGCKRLFDVLFKGERFFPYRKLRNNVAFISSLLVVSAIIAWPRWRKIEAVWVNCLAIGLAIILLSLFKVFNLEEVNEEDIG